MEALYEKKNFNINKKRKRRQSNKSRDINYNNADLLANIILKKKKRDIENITSNIIKSKLENIASDTKKLENITSDTKKSKSDLFQVVRSKSEVQNILDDYVVEKDKDEYQKIKISQKKLEKLEKVKERKDRSLPAKDPSAEERTIFVGNVNINTNREQIRNFFSKYGDVETVRLRGITPESMNMSKKEAVAKKLFNPHRKSLNAYVRFINADSAENALEANGSIFEELHIHVDKAMERNDKDKNSVFVGNLPWEINEEDLWKFFDKCGKVTNVRIVRSSTTGAGKGFGFVAFRSNDGVELALHLDGKTLMNRQLRVKKLAKKVKDNLKVMDRNRLKGKKNMKAMDVSFLKLDKPQISEMDMKEIKPKRKRHKSNVGAETENFSGTIAVQEGKALKKVKKRRSKADRKKKILAKKLANT